MRLAVVPDLGPYTAIAGELSSRAHDGQLIAFTNCQVTYIGRVGNVHRDTDRTFIVLRGAPGTIAVRHTHPITVLPEGYKMVVTAKKKEQENG